MLASVPLCLVTSFLGNVLSKSFDRLQGKAIDKALTYFTGAVLVRSAGHFGMAQNHDAAKAIRRAQMASLKCLLNAYATRVPRADEAMQFPELFVESALRFAEAATLNCDADALAVTAEVVEATAASLDAALGDIQTERFETRATSLRQAAEQAAFAEIEAVFARKHDPKTGRKIDVPGGFRDWFFHGRPKTENDDEIVGWHDGFVLFAARALKDPKEKFAAIFSASHLARTSALAFDTHEIATLTQASVATVDKLIEENAQSISRLEILLVHVSNKVTDLVDTQEMICDLLQSVSKESQEIKSLHLSSYGNTLNYSQNILETTNLVKRVYIYDEIVAGLRLANLEVSDLIVIKDKILDMIEPQLIKQITERRRRSD